MADLKTIQGLAASSVKTVQGLALASVASVQGLGVGGGLPVPPALGFYAQYSAAYLAAALGLGLMDTAVLAVWPDRTVNAEDLAQGTLGNRPTLMHDGTRWVVRFDGVADWMRRDLTNISAPWYAFTAFHVPVAPPSGFYTVWSESAANAVTLIVRDAPSLVMYFGGDNSLGAYASTMLQTSVRHRGGAGNTILRRNSTQTDSFARAADALSVLDLGQYASSFLLPGDIAELAFAPDVTDGERDDMEAYMEEIAVV